MGIVLALSMGHHADAVLIFTKVEREIYEPV